MTNKLFLFLSFACAFLAFVLLILNPFVFDFTNNNYKSFVLVEVINLFLFTRYSLEIYYAFKSHD